MLKGEAVPLLDFSREGFALIGWATDPSATAPDYAVGKKITLEEDTTLYAVWKPGVRVVFKFRDEGTTPDLELMVEKGSTFIVDLDDPVREGYVFLGWATEPDAAEAAQELSYVYENLEEDLYLFAQWAEPEPPANSVPVEPPVEELPPEETPGEEPPTEEPLPEEPSEEEPPTEELPGEETPEEIIPAEPTEAAEPAE